MPVRWVLRDDFKWGVRSTILRQTPESTLTWMGRQRAKAVCVSLAHYWVPQVRAILRRRQALFLRPHPGLSPSINNRTNFYLEEPQQDENARRLRHLPRPRRHRLRRRSPALGLVIFLGADFRACWHLCRQYGTTLSNLGLGRRVRVPSPSAGHPLRSPHSHYRIII